MKFQNIIIIFRKTAGLGFLLSVFTLTAFRCEDSECNYITDYYQLVYDAHLEYLKENYDTAYKLLKKAKSKCELLNQPEIRETVLYAELCARKGLYHEAFSYIEKALKSGFKFEYLTYNKGLTVLHKRPEWKELKAKVPESEKEFRNSINMELRAEIIAMNKADQEVRNPPNYNKMKITDSLNEKRMKDIFKTFGYPNEKLTGTSTSSQRTDITFMLMHFKDTAYFRPFLYDCIKKGTCLPNILGAMIDSQDRSTGLYTYGVYGNTDSTEIKDFKNLDNRRTAIGLRPWKKHKETMELVMKKYAQEQ